MLQLPTQSKSKLTSPSDSIFFIIYIIVLDYPWNRDEAKAGTNNPQKIEYGHLREWLSAHPYMQFNIFAGDLVTDTNWSSFKAAMETWNRVAGGSRFVTQDEFKRLLDEKVKTVDFGDYLRNC